MDVSGMSTDLAAHATAGAAVVYIIEWLKNAPGFKWLSHTTPSVSRGVSAIISLLIAVGVTANGSAETGWTITIPPLAAMTGVGWEFAQQFFSQQVIYDLVLNNRPAQRSTMPLPPTQGDPHDPLP
jgi:hypothetical protein